VLYRIDLSKTVSKWLGETEKILSQIFDLALDSPGYTRSANRRRMKSGDPDQCAAAML
jgi:hypothetical protein